MSHALHATNAPAANSNESIAADTVGPAATPAVDSLVEEVSIDGMCGVY